MTFGNRLWISFIGITVLFVILSSVVSTIISNKIAIRNTYQINQGKLILLSENINSYLNRCRKGIDILASDTSMMEQINAIRHSGDNYSRQKSGNMLDNHMRISLASQTEFNSLILIYEGKFALYSKNGEESIGNLSPEDISAGILDETYMVNIINGLYHEKKISNPVTKAHIILKKIWNNVYICGIVDFKANISAGEDVFFMLDRGKEIVFSNYEDNGYSTETIEKLYPVLKDPQQKRETVLNGRRYLLNMLPDSQLEYCFFLITESEMVFSEMSSSLRNTVITALILLIAFALLSRIISYRISAPIREFEKALKNTVSYDDRKAVGEFAQKYASHRVVRKKVILMYFMALIPVTVIIGLVSTLLGGMVIGYEKRDYVKYLEQLAKGIEYELNDYYLFARNLGFDPSLQEILERNGRLGEKKMEINNIEESRRVISTAIMDKGSLRKGFDYINVYEKGFKMIYPFLMEEPDYGVLEKCMPIKGDLFSQSTFYLDRNNKINILWKINSLSGLDSPYILGDTIGYIEIGVSDFFKRYFEDLGLQRSCESGIYSVEQDKLIYYTGQSVKNIDFKKLIDNAVTGQSGEIDYTTDKEKVFVSYRFIQEIGSFVCIFVPYRMMEQNIGSIYPANLALLFFLLLSIILMSRYLTQRILEPLNDLKSQFVEIAKGKLAEKRWRYEGGENEFVSLANTFENMMGRMEELSKELRDKEISRTDLEKRKKEAELIALQTQISPHFLYNLISSIVLLLRTNRIEDGIKVLKSAGNLFRIGIFKGNILIGINEEIEHVVAYLEVQNFRYKNRFIAEWKVDEQCKNLKVLKFIIQPLVENSLEHAFGNKKLMIAIRICIESGLLTIEVKDDGKGIPAVELDDLRRQLETGNYSENVGLRNVNERIKLFCGEAYGLYIDSEEGTGTRVRLRLPLIYGEA